MSSPSPIIVEESWWRRTSSAPVVLYAPCSRSECAQRLVAAIDSWWTPLGKKDAFGTVTENGGWLRRRTAYRNSLKTAARLTFHDEGSRTRIDVRFGVGALILLIVLSWALCLTAGIVTYVLTMERMPEPSEPAALPVFLLPPIAAIAIGIVIVVSRVTAKKDTAFLTEFIKTTLNASKA